MLESDTRVHIATVQAMAQRLLLGVEEGSPTVDSYDLIVVDECHRGYLLDRELSDRELRFRDFNDYVSKYRLVLEMFDAVKVALTATPALHTVQIFGRPVFVYSYREAVVDGYLVDHEPPLRIRTKLSSEGIRWEAGDEVQILDPRTGQLDLFTTPDELKFDVEAFNREVITEPFNRVVCEALADELDPLSPYKTLIFCVSNQHADLVVLLLKEAFAQRYGRVPDEAVAKITGSSDKPAQLIRRFKNEAFPNVAVTVDLLTTGVDVPEICNIVFLRRVNSRILYDQMIGRATRLCDAIGKDSFRVFDAVGLYDALQTFTDMKPVVVNPKIPFSQLLEEIQSTEGEDWQLVREQLIAKLRRKQRHLSETAEARFRLLSGEEPDAFIERLQQLPETEARAWLGRIEGLGELLDAQWEVRAEPRFLSDHDDELLSIERGYGEAQRPEDYLEGFSAFVRDPGNDCPPSRWCSPGPGSRAARIGASCARRWISAATAKPPWPRPGGKPPTTRWPPRSWAGSARRRSAIRSCRMSSGWRRRCSGSLPRASGANRSATGCNASPTKPRRSRSWIATPSTTTPCSSSGKGAAGRGSTACSAASSMACCSNSSRRCGRREVALSPCKPA